MFIRSIRIRDTTTNVIMREIFFHKGANFVVDTESSTRHNKVGKTTFLKLIDVLMGAKNRKHIYTDQETNNTTTALRDLITKKRIAVEMTLAQELEPPSGETVDLKVELFPHGHYFINDEQLPYANYCQKLNQLLFGIDDNIPTFRQLINSFVRVSVRGDDSSFLRTLPRANNATYRSVYNLLFGISDPSLDNKLSQLNVRRSRTQESLKQYKQVNGVEDTEVQRQILVALENEYKEIQAQADDIFDSDDYKNNRDTIVSVRSKYLRLTDQISELDYRLEQSREALRSARAELNRQADLVISRHFFEEVCAMIPAINKTFEDMVDFNVKLCGNKITYFEEIETELLAKRTALENERTSLHTTYGRYLSLVTKDRIDEYEQLLSTLMRLSQNIGKREEIVRTLERYEQELDSIQNSISSYSTGGSAREGKSGDYQDKMSSFNYYFKSFAQAINNEKPILVYSPDTDKFPMSITEIAGSSTGTRKSLIAAFDLAYQQFAIVNHIHSPRFVVHDVVENVEGEDLRTIIEVANKTGAQYIVAVLKEKLDSSQLTESEQRKLLILQLADDDRLFEGKSVDEAEARS